MYGNVGLATPRGSGTNGYVVRNLSYIRPKKDFVQYESYEEIAAKSASAFANRKPNQEILDHDKKRQVEIECILLRKKLEENEKSLTSEQVNERVDAHRKLLLSKLDQMKSKSIQEHQTHQLSEAKAVENAKMMKALGIDEKTYSEGAAFDKELQEQKKNERIVQKNERIVQRELEAERKRKNIQEHEKKRSLAENRQTNDPKATDRTREKRSKFHKEVATKPRRDKDNYIKGKKTHKKNQSETESMTESDSDISIKKKRHNKRLRSASDGYKQSFSSDDSQYDKNERRKPRSPRRHAHDYSTKSRGHRREGSIPAPTARHYKDGSASPPPKRDRMKALSSPRHRQNNDSLSPPIRRRYDDSVSPRRRPNHSLSPPMRKRHDSISPRHNDESSSQLRSRRRRFESLSLSPQRKSRVKTSPPSKYNEDESRHPFSNTRRNDKDLKNENELKTSGIEDGRKTHSYDKGRSNISDNRDSSPSYRRERDDYSPSRASRDSYRPYGRSPLRGRSTRQKSYYRYDHSSPEQDYGHRRTRSNNREVDRQYSKRHRSRESTEASLSSSSGDEYKNNAGSPILPEHLQKRHKGRHESSSSSSSSD